MKNHASVRRNLPLASVAARFLLVSLFIFATFNPSYYCLSIWILSGSSLLSAKALLAFGMAMCWQILLRISFEGLGWLGVAYAGFGFLILALLDWQFGVAHSVSEYAFNSWPNSPLLLS